MCDGLSIPATHGQHKALRFVPKCNLPPTCVKKLCGSFGPKTGVVPLDASIEH